MIKFLNKRITVGLLLAGAAVLFFCISFFSDATFDSGDGVSHFLISKFSWIHPHLLLNSWGKPFFTLISSPFSQFGMLGMNVFNILCAVGSAYCCYVIAKRFDMQSAWPVIIFLLFTPIYFVVINSGLTEPFFGLVLILSIYLVIDKKFIAAALLVSFLPHIRSEGYLILPLFGILFLYRRKIGPAFFLAFGTLVYSIVGYFFYHDLFWLASQNPYKGLNADLYGRGELFYFIKYRNEMFDPPLWTILLGGIGILLLYFVFLVLKKDESSRLKRIIKNKFSHPFFAEETLLVYGSFLVYFIAHSIFWWKGIFGSLGIFRVMAAVIPASALICLRGFNFIVFPGLSSNRWIKGFMYFIIIPYIIFIPFSRVTFPPKLDGEQQLIKETTGWLKNTNYLDNQVYYISPYMGMLLEVDVYDTKKIGELWGLYTAIDNWGIEVIPSKTVVIWDAHFGPNECRIPLEKIRSDKNFKLLKSFYPQQPFKVLGEHNYEIHVFQKVE